MENNDERLRGRNIQGISRELLIVKSEHMLLIYNITVVWFLVSI